MRNLKYISILSKAAILRLKNKEQAQNYLMHAIGKIPGVPAKFSQVLSMKHQWYTAAEQVHPNKMDLEMVQDIITKTSPLLKNEITSISDHPSIASLSQVHEATLNNGQQVAIKVQFPGLIDEIKEQMKVIHFVLLQSPAMSYNFNDQLFIEYFQKSLLSELDYLEEAKTQAYFHDYFQNKKIYIPQVYPELSNEMILVQEFIRGTQLNELKNQSYEIRFKAARLITQFILESIFQTGTVHGDFQPQNWAYQIEMQKLIVYDFGSVIRLTKGQQEGLIRLILSQNDVDTLMGYSQLGFSQKNLSIIADRLHLLTQEIIKPFKSTNWSAKEWQLQKTTEEILGNDKWWFRAAGQPWFLHLMRSISYWAFSLKELDVKIDLQEILFKAIHDFQVTEDQQLRSQLQKTFDQRHRQSYLSQYLKVQVLENNQIQVEVTLPAVALEEIEFALSEQVLTEIKNQGIDLAEIKRSALFNHYQPCQILDIQIDNKKYRVWLE